MALPVQIASAQTSTFGLARVAMPTSLFALTHEYTAHPLIWDPVTAGTGAISHLTASNSVTLATGGTADAARAMHQTKVYHRYQPGKAQLVKVTGVPVLSGTVAAGAVARMGYFDDDNGVYFGVDVNGPFFAVRTNTSGSVVENKAYQNPVAGTNQWNMAEMRPGSGNTPRREIDSTKAVIVVIDLQWLGVGVVRCGFQFGDFITYVHTFQHAGVVTVPYMRTANLPIRYEVINVGAGADITMRKVCAAVESEGGVQNPPAYSFTASNKGTPISAADSATLTPILTIRLVDTLNSMTYRGHVNLKELSWLNTTANPGYWELILNAATLTSTAGVYHRSLSRQGFGAGTRTSYFSH
jgi:hypothetical protein